MLSQLNDLRSAVALVRLTFSESMAVILVQIEPIPDGP